MEGDRFRILELSIAWLCDAVRSTFPDFQLPMFPVHLLICAANEPVFEFSNWDVLLMSWLAVLSHLQQ